jgi:hypothetical protein
MTMLERSILATSGQLTKATVLLALFLAGALLTTVGAFGWVSGSPETQFLLAAAGILVALGAGIYGVTSIRCPKCRARWVWLAVSKSGASSWLATLLGRDKCPVCDWSARCRDQLQ